MKLASLVINEFKNNNYNTLLEDIYVDGLLVEKQVGRYVEAINKFVELYGDQEIEIYSVPGRSEVSGNHTDHQRGEVLAASINLDIIAVVAKNEGSLKILSDTYDLKAIDLNDLEKKEDEEEAKLICSYSPPLNLKSVPFDENQSFRAELSLLRSKHSR
mgnify:CR=1 FL=1